MRRIIEGTTTFMGNENDVLHSFNNPAIPHLPLPDLAFDSLSIPAMSAEIERIFSAANDLLLYTEML